MRAQARPVLLRFQYPQRVLHIRRSHPHPTITTVVDRIRTTATTITAPMTLVAVIRVKTEGQMATGRHREVVSEEASVVEVEVADHNGGKTGIRVGGIRVLTGQSGEVAHVALHDRRIIVEILGSGVLPVTLKLNRRENSSWTGTNLGGISGRIRLRRRQTGWRIAMSQVHHLSAQLPPTK